MAGGPAAPAGRWDVRDAAGAEDDQGADLAWGMVPFGHGYEYHLLVFTHTYYAYIFYTRQVSILIWK